MAAALESVRTEALLDELARRLMTRLDLEGRATIELRCDQGRVMEVFGHPRIRRSDFGLLDPPAARGLEQDLTGEPV
jgi:hypothetical protein